MNKLKWIVYCLSVIFLLPTLAAAEKPKKSVLYLNSYHHGYGWSDSILEGARSVLDTSQYKIDLQIEYMDAKRYNYEDVTALFVRLYKEKFATKQFDVVMVSDNDAFTFVVQHREELFPGVPIVFSGVNDYEAKGLQQDNMTGVVELFDMKKTLEVALKLHPEKKHMIVVTDSSTTGTAIKHQVQAIVPQFKERLTVDYWIDISMQAVMDRVTTLPDDTFLFAIPYYQIIDGRFSTAQEVVESISKHSSVPIYTCWGFLIGHGTVGGHMISGFLHGKTAAELALKVLDGTPAEDIPIYDKPIGEYIFDYTVMERLGIDQKLLPTGSLIVNTPKAFYELPKELFWTIIISFALLLLVLVFLIYGMIERRKVERKVKDQLAFQQTLMDTVPQLVSWKSINGRYLGSNRAFADFFGIKEEDSVVNKTSRDVLRDVSYADWAVKADMAVAQNRQAFRKVRKKLLDANGEQAWIEINKVPINDRSGQIVGILSTAENITKERNLEKQLLQSQKMEAIGTLAGGIAHDFNNILTSIINSTELAVSDIDPDSVTGKDLKRVLKAARRGGRVVKQILAFSRPSKEGFRSTDVGVVITEVLGLMESSMPRNIEVKTHIAPAPAHVHADPTQIHQVAMNLCTNAFHALRETGGVIRVSLDHASLKADDTDVLGISPGDYVRLVVEDNGPGIPPDILDKIFDPFFSTKDKTEGTGLGLAVVHGIIRSHNGGVQVTPRQGGGTVFSIYLPQSEKPSSHNGRNANGKTSTNARILFVEDDQDQLHTTPRLLETMGYETIAMDDPVKAMNRVAEDMTPFDLIITDYDMPEVSGTQLAARLALIDPTLPIILVSGREDAATAAVDLPNIRRVVIKPYDKKDLSHAINAVLTQPEGE
ncbi:response regulator [Pseudodesulfovibrio sp. JC047]|uniref:hybrid sensor histidine kinase/response regulator n=1 Tax=Pseudodesulfovibrio sp. JC047 TaxID=2683199 RepID=UPI0013D5E134|nr:ABC transporter substrate binding protein [Pseudodesulfovibrio sp. JC047]NDV19618.1 response regulator [Pseudodesulfovibrio sp. JC047]